jgi:nucleoid DNA-binding protein
MSLTKRDLVYRISNETGLIQNEVQSVVQRTLDYIAEELARGRNVELRQFGVFEVKVRKPRLGRDLNHQESAPIKIPRRAVVKFKAGKQLREKMVKLV